MSRINLVSKTYKYIHVYCIIVPSNFSTLYSAESQQIKLNISACTPSEGSQYFSTSSTRKISPFTVTVISNGLKIF